MENDQQPIIEQNQISNVAISKLSGSRVWMSIVGLFFIATAGVLLYGVITHIMKWGFVGLEFIAIPFVVALFFIFLSFLLFRTITKIKTYSSSKQVSDLERALKTANTFWIAFAILGIIGIAGWGYALFGL